MNYSLFAIHISILPSTGDSIVFFVANIQPGTDLGPRRARVGINSEMVPRWWRRCDSTCCQPAKVSKPARSAAMSHIRAEAADDSGTADRRVRLLYLPGPACFFRILNLIPSTVFQNLYFFKKKKYT